MRSRTIAPTISVCRVVTYLPMASTDTQKILAWAHEVGFDLANVAPATRLPHAERYLAWLERDHNGHMGYMARNQGLRVDPRELFQPTRAVVAVGLLYGTPEDGPIARYARGVD